MMKSATRWFKSPFGKVVLATLGVFALSAVSFYYVELRPRGENDLFAAAWWTVVTLTTVGYGDIVPVTPWGRVIGIVVMFSGIGLVSTLSGNLASLLVERQAKKRKGLLEVKAHRHILILGWNSYGLNLARSLAGAGVLEGAPLILVNALPPEVRDDIAVKLALDDRLEFVWGNPCQEAVLRRANVQDARLAYILCQDGVDPKDADQQSIYTALTLRSLAPKLPLYGEVLNSDNREHMLRAGVNEIVVRGEFVSHILGLMGATPTVWTFFRSLIGVNEAGMLGYRALVESEQRGRWSDLARTLRQESGVLPLALCKESRAMALKDLLDEGSALDQFIMELFQATGQQSHLGRSGPSVIVNPSDAQDLSGYDGVLYLKAAHGGAQG